MRIKTTGQNIGNDIQVVVMDDLTSEELKLRVQRDSDGNETAEKKLVDGRPTYSIPGVQIRQDKKPIRECYLSVWEQQDLEGMTKYRLDGEIIINSYGTVSTITAERLVPLDEKPSGDSKPIGNLMNK